MFFPKHHFGGVWHACHSRCAADSLLSPLCRLQTFTSMQAPEVELGSLGFCSSHLYPLSHFTGPASCFPESTVLGCVPEFSSFLEHTRARACVRVCRRQRSISGIKTQISGSTGLCVHTKDLSWVGAESGDCHRRLDKQVCQSLSNSFPLESPAFLSGSVGRQWRH